MINLSQKYVKLLRLCKQKKYRHKHNIFLAEGQKVVQDLLNSNLKFEFIVIDNESQFFVHPKLHSENIFLTDKKTFSEISNQSTPDGILGVFEIPILPENYFNQKNIAVLDGVNDPGNLGTIIRTAHWYGIETIICSSNSVDVYNPKTVQSSMGSLGFVNVYYKDLKTELAILKSKGFTVFGTLLEGENLKKVVSSEKNVWMMGSESHGISEDLIESIDHKVSILATNPKSKPESLNLSIAFATVMYQIS